VIVDLLRHGTTGRAGYLDGRTDLPLSHEGLEQFRRQTQSQVWRGIVSSHLKRAALPAAALAQNHGIAHVIDPEWAELDFGAWDGRRRTDIEADPDQSAALAAFYADPRTHSPPDGEDWPHFHGRVSAAVSRIATRSDPGPLLVVTHAGPMRAALSHVCGLPLHTTWAFRIAYGTRIRLQVGTTPAGALWGEIIEIAQP
jgi:alpha-ribazole phosphatase